MMFLNDYFLYYLVLYFLLYCNVFWKKKHEKNMDIKFYFDKTATKQKHKKNKLSI